MNGVSKSLDEAMDSEDKNGYSGNSQNGFFQEEFQDSGKLLYLVLYTGCIPIYLDVLRHTISVSYFQRYGVLRSQEGVWRKPSCYRKDVGIRKRALQL